MKSSVSKNIFLSFSTIIIIYTGIVLFVFITKEVSRQTYESTIETEFYVEREANRIDSQIETALTSTQILADNKKIQELTYLTKSDYGLFSDIFDEMKSNLFSDYQLGYNVGITQKEGNQVVGPQGYFNFDDYLTFIGIPPNDPELRSFFQSNDRNRIRVICVDQNLYLLRKIYQADKPAALYFIVNWKQQNLLDKTSIDYLRGRMYFFDSESTQDQASGVLAAIKTFTPLKPTKENQIKVTRKGTETAIWKSSKTVPSLIYLYVLPTTVLSMVPLDTIWIIIGLLLGLLALGSLLTIYFSRRSYRPYRRIISEIQSDATTSSNVEAVLESIEKLRITNQNFKRFREENLEDIREMFFKNILLGKYTHQELIRIVPIIGLQPIENGGLIAILTIFGRASAEESLSERELLKARQRIIEYGTDTKDIVLFVQPISPQKFALIFSTKDQEIVLDKVSALRDLFTKELKIVSKIVLSVPFDTIDQFSTTFREAISLNTDTLFSTEEIIVNRSLDKRVNYTYSVEAEQRLVHLVKSKQTDEAARLLENIIRNNFIERRLSTYSIEEFKQLLINTIKRMMSVLGTDYPTFYKEHHDLFDRLIGTDTKDLYRVYTAIFQEVFMLAETNIQKNFDVMDRLLSYIDSHYAEDLSLSELADQFHLTESYLSKLIKEGTGITFKNYLNQLKVNRAKMLLAEGKLRVAEVAKEVGVKNVNTFIRMFKQYEGVTPGKYVAYKEELDP